MNIPRQIFKVCRGVTLFCGLYEKRAVEIHAKLFDVKVEYLLVVFGRSAERNINAGILDLLFQKREQLFSDALASVLGKNVNFVHHKTFFAHVYVGRFVLDRVIMPENVAYDRALFDGNK